MSAATNDRFPASGNYGAIPTSEAAATQAPSASGFAFDGLLREINSWGVKRLVCFLLSFVAVVLFLSFWFGAFGYLSLTITSNEQYVVYVMRHAEERKVKKYKCDPPQDPPLPPTIGACGDWGDNRCGGDYLTNTGLERAHCIARLPFEGASYILTQYPGTCFDKGVIKREYQSMLPLAAATGIEIDATLRKGDNFLAAELLKSEKMRAHLCSHYKAGVSVKTLKSGSSSSNSVWSSWALGGEATATETGTATWSLRQEPTSDFQHVEQQRLLSTMEPVHEGNRRSAVVSWDHVNIPLLLRFLGCPAENELCTDRFPKHEFDMLFKVTMGCSNGKLLHVEKEFEGCNAAAAGDGEDEGDSDGDDDAEVGNESDGNGRASSSGDGCSWGRNCSNSSNPPTPTVAVTTAPTPFPHVVLDYNTSSNSNAPTSQP